MVAYPPPGWFLTKSAEAVEKKRDVVLRDAKRVRKYKEVKEIDEVREIKEWPNGLAGRHGRRSITTNATIC